MVRNFCGSWGFRCEIIMKDFLVLCNDADKIYSIDKIINITIKKELPTEETGLVR